MTPILEARNVKKSYRMGKLLVPALVGVSFDVKEGEFLTIFGPSGSGKPTMLHLLGGLDRPDEGEIIIDGEDILKLSDSRLAELRLTKIGFVVQFFNLLPRLAALRNVELPLAIAGISEKETVEKRKEILPQRFRIAWGSFPEPEDNDKIILGYKAGIGNETAVVGLGENVTQIITAQVNSTFAYNLTRQLRAAGLMEEGGTAGITNFDYWAFVPTRTILEMCNETEEKYRIIPVKASDPKLSEQVAKDIEAQFEKYSISILVPSSFMRQVESSEPPPDFPHDRSVSLAPRRRHRYNERNDRLSHGTDREVGVLKAIGAKSQTILTMFLTEAAIIGVMGGFIGMFAGYGLSYVLVMALKFHAAATTAGHLVLDALERTAANKPYLHAKMESCGFRFRDSRVLSLRSLPC